VLHCFGHKVEDADGIVLKRLAVSGEPHRASVAFEQQFADQILKAVDVLAYCGLRQMHSLGSASEASRLRNPDEAAKEIRRQPIYHDVL
jgi:hypothetical protein